MSLCARTGVSMRYDETTFLGEKMAATKITVNHNGSLRIEGDFELVDPEGRPFGLAGRTSLAFAAADTPLISPFATARTRLAASRIQSLRANCRHPNRNCDSRTAFKSETVSTLRQMGIRPETDINLQSSASC